MKSLRLVWKELAAAAVMHKMNTTKTMTLAPARVIFSTNGFIIIYLLG